MHKPGVLGELQAVEEVTRQLWNRRWAIIVAKYQPVNVHKLGILGQLRTEGGSETGDGMELWMKYQSGNMHKLVFCLLARG
ncbi:uncharacterized protein [Periplaneta americana]|uniref:uncharacterized protein isoform X2 n=1 Tax=Periplaneta americana TaxID=6978 RepID=UPI0037E71463